MTEVESPAAKTTILAERRRQQTTTMFDQQRQRHNSMGERMGSKTERQQAHETKMYVCRLLSKSR